MKHHHIFDIFVWDTAQKSIHMESVQQSGLSLGASRRTEELSIGIKQACKAAHKSSADLIRPESSRADEAHMLSAP